MTSQSKGSQSLLLGVLFVALGASSYGMLSTFVKLSYKQGFTTAEVTIAQVLWGAFILSLLRLFARDTSNVSREDVKALMLAGVPIGATSIFYYMSVKYIDASIAVVLLMQSVWLGVVVESIQTRKWPSLEKIVAVVLVLVGTLLATNALNTESSLDIRGVLFGFISALSFTGTLFATGTIAKHLPPVTRSQFMLYGATLLVIVFALITQLLPYYADITLVPNEFVQAVPFKFKIFLTFGLFVAIFGTVIPPITLNRGFPITGVGLGSIVSSLELPCAMTFAYILLGEKVLPIQWVGVAIILAAIVLLNYKLIRNR